MDRRRVCAPVPRRMSARLAGCTVAALLIAGSAMIIARVPEARATPAVAAGPASPLAAAGAVERIAPRPAAPGGAAATTVSADGGNIRVSVDPARGLPAFNAAITVRGAGFNADNDLWVAVCADDGSAPASLTHCIGGAIPDGNSTGAWAIVTSARGAPYAGPVVTRWRAHGSFDVTLQVQAAAGQDVDCVSQPCSVYTRSADSKDRGQDVRVPVQFSAQSPSGPAGPPRSTAGSTQTLGAVATTVTPDSMGETSVAAGGTQTVVFSGFKPAETVDVTLYSDPISLPAVQADGRGVVTVSFTVPADLPPGEHLIQAIGRSSGRVGIAQFEVGAAAATTTTVTATETSATENTLVTETSAAAGVVPSGEISSAESTPTTPTTADTTLPSSEEAAAPVPADSGPASTPSDNRLIWLWVVLAVLVAIGAAAGLVVMLRRRRLDHEPLAAVDEVRSPDDAAGAYHDGFSDGYDDVPDRAGWPAYAAEPHPPAGPEPAPHWDVSVPTHGAAGGAGNGTGAGNGPGDGGPPTEAIGASPWSAPPPAAAPWFGSAAGAPPSSEGAAPAGPGWGQPGGASAPSEQGARIDPGPPTEEWHPEGASQPAPWQPENGPAADDGPGRPIRGRHRSD